MATPWLHSRGAGWLHSLAIIGKRFILAWSSQEAKGLLWKAGSMAVLGRVDQDEAEGCFPKPERLKSTGKNWRPRDEVQGGFCKEVYEGQVTLNQSLVTLGHFSAQHTREAALPIPQSEENLSDQS